MEYVAVAQLPSYTLEVAPVQAQGTVTFSAFFEKVSMEQTHIAEAETIMWWMCCFHINHYVMLPHGLKAANAYQDFIPSVNSKKFANK